MAHLIVRGIMVSYPANEKKEVHMKESSKGGCAGGLFKVAVKCMLLLSVFLILIVVALPLWISPVVTGIAGRLVPGYTGTGFDIDRFDLNPYSGTLGINGVKLANPDGFGNSAAFSLSRFDVKVSVGSLFSDTILIREVVIDEAFASYYSHDGKNNFDVIMENVDRSMGPKKDGPSKKTPEKKGDSQGKKVIIERLCITGTKVKLMKSDLMPALALPSIELTDIGKKSKGVTLEEAWTQISAAVMKSMGDIGDGLGGLGGILGDGAKDIAKALDDGAKRLTSATEGVSSKTAKTTEKTVGAVGAVTEKTVETVGDAAKETLNTVEAVGDAAKETLNAVEDTAQKAADGVKNLFKGFRK